MFRAVLLFAILVCGAVEARECKRCQRDPSPPLAAERVELPDDSGKMYLTVFGDANDPAFRRLVSWFRAEPLACIKDVTHFTVITTTHPLWRVYARLTPVLPCVRLQRCDGKTKYQAAGQDMPQSAESLANDLECLAQQRKCGPLGCPLRNRLEQRHETPAPEKQNAPAQPLVEQPRSREQFPWILLAIVVLGGAVAGVAIAWRKEYGAT